MVLFSVSLCTENINFDIIQRIQSLILFFMFYNNRELFISKKFVEDSL